MCIQMHIHVHPLEEPPICVQCLWMHWTEYMHLGGPLYEVVGFLGIDQTSSEHCVIQYLKNHTR